MIIRLFISRKSSRLTWDLCSAVGLSEASSEEEGFTVNIFRIKRFGLVLNLYFLRRGKFISLDAKGHLDR